MELLEDVHLSDFTKKTLEQFAWKVGEPIPADLGATLLKIKETLPPETAARTDVLVDRQHMSEEQVQEILSLLSRAKVAAAKLQAAREVDAVTRTMDPSVAAVYHQLAEEDENSPKIIDDREAPAASPQPETTATVAPDAPAEDSEEDTAGLLAAAAPPFCPRCGWNMQQQFEVKPTDADKEDFVVSLLGEIRFLKQYELFGGRMVVTFRTLFAEENKRIYRQLVLDQKSGKISTETEWFVQLMEYRLACSLASVTDRSGKILTAIPTLPDLPADQQPETAEETGLLPQLALLDAAFKQEGARRIVAGQLREFQRLVEALEAMAVEPSFWNGIG